ncbi:MAG: hypothetical protein VKJ46_13280 [Leptolyngbyaceae bacterium]|nr:hypothetical protein [Leptolyngbyaceae bacterium]
MGQKITLLSLPALFAGRPHWWFSLLLVGTIAQPATSSLSTTPATAQAVDPLLRKSQKPLVSTSAADIALLAASKATSDSARDLDLNPEIIESSPVLQRWLQEVPDVLSNIANEPSFRTRFRIGYSQFPSTNQEGGWHAGVEDLRVGRTSLTISGDYQSTFNPSPANAPQRLTWGTDVRYYLRPLGSYVNVTPVLGYRQLQTNSYSTDGINLGVRVLLTLSRSGAADLALTQSWVAPGSDREVGITHFSAGYALTHHLRLSTDIQIQNARQGQDSRVGVGLEWML